MGTTKQILSPRLTGTLHLKTHIIATVDTTGNFVVFPVQLNSLWFSLLKEDKKSKNYDSRLDIRY